MARISSTIIALVMSINPDISIYDSKTEPGYSWILVDECPVKVKTVDLKLRQDEVIDKVNKMCGLYLDDINVTKKE